MQSDQDFLKQLGKTISRVRRSKGMSQTNLGDIIDMEKSNLSAIENGKQNATSLTLKKIAEALEVEVRELLSF